MFLRNKIMNDASHEFDLCCFIIQLYEHVKAYSSVHPSVVYYKLIHVGYRNYKDQGGA